MKLEFIGTRRASARETRTRPPGVWRNINGDAIIDQQRRRPSRGFAKHIRRQKGKKK